MGLTIGSLFSGIGGLELGLERAGLGPVKWQVEIDPYCRAVLAKHWPDARRYEDVRSVGPELERVDLICGGFPCQDISCAGKRGGIEGARSGLWSEYIRIVSDIRPRFVVVENVGDLVHRGLDSVLAGLASVGMDAIWFPLAAADLGAPHDRNRLFIVAYAAGVGLDNEANVEVVGGSRGRELQPREPGCVGARASVLDPEVERRVSVGREQQQGGRHQAGDVHLWEIEPNVGRVADGVPNRTHRIAGLGNAVVPQVAEVVGWVVRGIAEMVAP